MVSWATAVEPAPRFWRWQRSQPFYYGCLAVGYTLVAIYGSVVPLNFTWPDQGFFEAAQTRFSLSRTNSLSVFDAAANVALFVPLGFLWSATVLYSGSFAGRMLRSITVVGCAALLSALIEGVQIGLPARTTSPLDILAETAGATLGCALWWGWGVPMSIWLAARQPTELKAQQWNWALQIYLGTISICWLLPLDLTCRPGELSMKFRHGGVILKPFSEITAERALRAGLALGLFVPVGVLVATAGTQATGRVRSERECRWLIVALASLLAAGQLLVFSRRSDILEIAAMAIGMVGGVSLASLGRTGTRACLWSTFRDWQRPRQHASRSTLGASVSPALTCHMAVVTATMALFFWQSYVASPGTVGITGRLIPDWRPTWGFELYWFLAFSCLLFVPRFPVMAPLVFSTLCYGVSSSGHVSGGFFRAVGGLELVLIAGGIGVALSRFGKMNELGRGSWVPWLATAYALWAIISAGQIWAEGHVWKNQVTVQCFRIFDCTVVVWMAAFSIRTRSADLLLALSLGLGVLLSGVLFPDGVHKNHVMASIVAVSLPIAVYSLTQAPHMAIQIPLGLVLLKLAAMLYSGESRSAVAGAAAGLCVYAAASRYRWLILGAMAPGIALATWWSKGSFLAQRFKALLFQEEGWDTGRLEVWKYALDVFRKHPILGEGPGMGPAWEENAHNSYLSVLSETGLVGLALYVLLWLATVTLLGWVMWKNGDRWPGSTGKALLAATAAQLVIGFGYSLHGLQLAFLIAGWSVALACVARANQTLVGHADSGLPRNGRIR